jgi:glycosyltransferase involved in cell wall biosynthesis
MLQDGAGLLVPPGDPAALAAAVERLVRDPTLARDVVTKAGQTVERFTAARMAEAVGSVYRSLASFH